MSGVITAIAGGALGGWIVDIDLKGRKIELDQDRKRENIYDTVLDMLLIGVFLILDYLY